MTERITSQRKIILDYLKSVKTHPSTEEVYLAVKQKLPQISLGTVYRNLKKLKEEGEIQEVFGEVSHYDGDISPHAHFICERCKKIFDIFGEFNVPKKKIKVGEVRNYQLYYYGICKKCQKR